MSGNDDFISRWSRRKAAAKGGTPGATPAAVPAQAGPRLPTTPNQQPSEARAQAPTPLPPVDSLTFESDFTAFMGEGVDPGVRRAALRTLLRDPRFNVMDGLDVYIDDYTKSDPIPPEWMEQLNQMKHLGHYIEEKLEEKEGGEPAVAQEAGSEKSLEAPAQAGAPQQPDDAPQQSLPPEKTPDRGQ